MLLINQYNYYRVISELYRRYGIYLSSIMISCNNVAVYLLVPTYTFFLSPFEIKEKIRHVVCSQGYSDLFWIIGCDNAVDLGHGTSFGNIVLVRDNYYEPIF